MIHPRLIYCDGKNKALAQIAIDHGFEYGIRYPSIEILDHKISFVDVDWKKPERKKYIQGVLFLQPNMASVIDITSEGIFAEALEWANEVAPAVNKIILIPKIDVIDRIPGAIQGKEVILGYSVPSSYGKTTIPFERFTSFPVHLLGGSPHSNVVYSVDGNYMTRMANKTGRHWVSGNNEEITNRFWCRNLTKSRHELFELSCRNIKKAWQYILIDNLWLRDRRKKV
jgi:hypothetical protein